MAHEKSSNEQSVHTPVLCVRRSSKCLTAYLSALAPALLISLPHGSAAGPIDSAVLWTVTFLQLLSQQPPHNLPTWLSNPMHIQKGPRPPLPRTHQPHLRE